MKFKKQKRHRRTVRFYTASFDFRKPFKILCDGTFIHHLLSNQITSADDALTNILGAPTKLFTTRCTIAELKKLGPSYSESFQSARSLITARCDHEKIKSAAACIEEVIGDKNSEHFFVATQDTDLRKTFQEVPGVPVIYGLRNALFLDPPSEFQRQCAKKEEEKNLHLTSLERKQLQTRGESKVATDITTDSPDTQEGLGDQDVMAQSSTKRNNARRMQNVVDKPRFKRKKAKGPNPLSCKKKKTHGSLASNQDRKNDENPSRKRNRKRKRSSKSIKAGETDG